MTDNQETLAGWGRIGVPGHELLSEDFEQITANAVLARGLGRSYGDASLPPAGIREVAGSVLADRLLAFDPKTGWLRAEAGVSLAEVLRVFMPRGWFPAVTPGTKFVTLGGMVASDVHGKNHHREGCIGEHVRWMKLRVSDRRIVECSAEQYIDLFHATLGGMGLTGHILEVETQLQRIPSPWIWAESERVANIDEFIAGLQTAAQVWPFTMGWIDCLTSGSHMGRGILHRGRWATPTEAPTDYPKAPRKLRVPMVVPDWVMSRPIVQAFNILYYWKHVPKSRQGIVHPDSFFYPLDAIHDWNKLYGPSGFTQYQCVLPSSAGVDAARRLLELLVQQGGASFLCVIKDCGPEGSGLLSFPMRGISIALDIPVRKDTQHLVDLLNEHVIHEGGRIYLTKDSLTRPEHFQAMEPRLAEWKRVRDHWDPQHHFRSRLSQRLFGDK